MFRKLKFLNIKSQLLIISFLIVTVPVTILGVLSYVTIKTEIYMNVEKELRTIAKDWHIITKTYILEEERILKREEFLVQKKLEVIAQNVRTLLDLAADENNIVKRAKIIEKISEIQIGRSGYVFVLDQNDNYITTHEQALNGKNFFETIIGSDNELFKNKFEVIRNSSQIDVRVVHASWGNIFYPMPKQKMVVLTGIKSSGMIIGAVSNYTDYKSEDLERKLQDEVRRKMAQINILTNGYLWVINSKGDYIVSKNMYRNGENVLDLRDQNGELFVSKMIKNTKKIPEGEIYVYSYPWKNIGEENFLMKVSAMTYVPEWDWVIGASAYNQDFLKALVTIRRYFIQISAIAIIIGSFVAYIFALFISRPIEELESISKRAAKGELDIEFGNIVKLSGEIGSLAKSFQMMILRLKVKINETELSKFALEKSNIELGILNAEFVKNEKNLKQALQETKKMHEALKNTQKQLFQSEKLAAIGQLSAGVAHEINNPTSFVLSNLESLIKDVEVLFGALHDLEYLTNQYFPKNENDNSPFYEEFEKIVRDSEIRFLQEDLPDLIRQTIEGVRRIQKIVSNLKSFAHPGEEGKRLTNVNEEIENALNLINSEIKYYCTVNKNFNEVPQIQANAQQLERVFINLIMNAAQSIEGKGVITIASYEENHCVIVEISDTGKGIPENEISKIYDPFHTTKPVGKGTGLGLSIVYGIIEYHKGHIEVKSVVGQGTKFKISFPITTDI